MATRRRYSIEFKRQVVQEYQAGETLHGLAKRHGISRNLVRIWAAKAEAGEFDDDHAAASILQEYEARIGALERLAHFIHEPVREDVMEGDETVGLASHFGVETERARLDRNFPLVLLLIMIGALFWPSEDAGSSDEQVDAVRKPMGRTIICPARSDTDQIRQRAAPRLKTVDGLQPVVCTPVHARWLRRESVVEAEDPDRRSLRRAPLGLVPSTLVEAAAKSRTRSGGSRNRQPRHRLAPGTPSCQEGDQCTSLVAPHESVRGTEGEWATCSISGRKLGSCCRRLPH